jgi:haloalkane dehalogenase
MRQTLTILTLVIMSTNLKAQSWLDTNQYPFQSNFISLAAGNMHYVDEGEGDVMLFIHGTPTWSFLYRDYIKVFSKDYRCIAIDHLGFGLSEKPDSSSGTPEYHAKNLTEFIEKLDLQNVTLVVHDFGGPIGLSVGINHSEKINRVVLFNTWLWSTKERADVQKIDKTINSWLGKFLYLNMNFSPKALLPKGFADKKNLTKAIHKQYIYPFPDKGSRQSLLNLAKSLKGSSDWYEKQWEQLDEIVDKEWLIIWGTEDQFIKKEYLDKWKKRIPNATVHELECGHFVQEEKTKESIGLIRKFMED